MTSDMAQWVKGTSMSKPDGISWIPGTHMMEGEN